LSQPKVKSSRWRTLFQVRQLSTPLPISRILHLLHHLLP
jgi:hypothetical protein